MQGRESEIKLKVASKGPAYANAVLESPRASTVTSSFDKIPMCTPRSSSRTLPRRPTRASKDPFPLHDEENTLVN